MIYEYKELKFESIMKPMIVWGSNEADAHEVFIIIKHLDGRQFPWVTTGGINWKNAKPVPQTKPRTIEDGLVKGDIIVQDSNEAVVLAVLENLVFRSMFDDNKVASNTVYTHEELIKLGFKLKQPESTESTEKPINLTFKDISEGKGVGVPTHLINIVE